MELCYYKSTIGNFGDDLNPYIFNQLIPNFSDLSDDYVIFFIGTILYDNFVGANLIRDFDKKKKIVLGSGVRFIDKPPTIDSTWDVRFLRGPLSSLSLFNSFENFITDPAYLIREMPFFENLTNIKKYKISIMPHFLSIDKIEWQKLCDEFGVNFIDPECKDLEFILSEIAMSELIITEAMHGAIIADAFRIPWKRFKYSSYVFEKEIVSEFKWSDWLFSMKLKNTSTFLNYNKVVRFVDKKFDVPLLKQIRYKNIYDSFYALIKDDKYQLSHNDILDEKLGRLLDEINILKKQIG
jgi:hypothetical protein